MGMSRQRMLPPDIFTMEDLIELPHEVRLSAIGLRMNADDHGRGSARTDLLKASIWPLTAEITLDVIEEHLVMLDDLRYIQLYSGGGRGYYAVSDWPAVSHPAASKYPEPGPRTTRQNPAGTPLESFPAGERGGESGWRDPAEGQEGEGAWRDAEGLTGDPQFPPSEFCPEHPTGTFQDCGPCGTARKQAKLWRQRKRAQSRVEFTPNDY